MRFTDIFIRRPVLATVVSLLILLVGARAMTLLEVREYPETENTTVTVTTAYPGASSEVVKGFVTTPLQQAIAEAEGIDYLSATSQQGISTIEARMELNYDANDAVAEIQAKVASQRNVLPEAAQDPVIQSTTGDDTALMYLAFYGENSSTPQISDYLTRVVQPKLQALKGVAKARLIGKPFAMRIWLNPERMNALGVTASDITQVLRANNFLASVGRTKDKYVAVNLTASTDITTAEGFRDLVIKSDGDTLVRLRDVARAELGAEEYDTASWYNGKPAVFIGIEKTPGSNPLTVAQRVQDTMPAVRGSLPEAMNVTLPYDSSEFIQNSIDEVIKTILEAGAIVLVVIFLCLGSLRAAIVPSVAVPLSLVGAGFIMLALGYSLNLLTLLSMVLAIGLVVDDAIIVVENVHRHIEEGMPKRQAALIGARELAVPIIAMTTTLLAVYAPIGFQGGLTGALFTEFAFTLAGAVLVSGVVALTLSPVLSAAVLKPKGQEGGFEIRVQRFFSGLGQGYKRLLGRSLETVTPAILFGIVILAAIPVMWVMSQSELAPTEDQGIIFFQATGPQTASLDYLQAYASDIQNQMEDVPGYKESFMILGRGDKNTVFGGYKMPNFADREITQFEAKPELDKALSKVAGFDIAAFPRPTLPGSGGGLPVQFVITTSDSYEDLDQIGSDILQRARESGQFLFLNKSVEIDRPVTDIQLDRERAADLGISMQQIASNLGSLLGEGYVNRFNLAGRSYEVIPQVQRPFRLDESMIGDYRIRTDNGEQIPLKSLVTFERSVAPSKRTEFQQLNALTLEGVVKPGTPMGTALSTLEEQARAVFPKGYGIDYKGQSRQYVQQGNALLITMFLSVMVIYLMLAAQFESWRDPLIILVSVPMAMAGALAFIFVGYASLNIYTQVGLITLIGVIAKNGILIVEFANEQQRLRGLSKLEAVLEAGAIRLRPIIMTSVALVVAMVPLLLASGPGSVSRQHIGLTIAAGLGIGTLFTLFVLPAFYMLIARQHRPADDSADREADDPQGEADPT